MPVAGLRWPFGDNPPTDLDALVGARAARLGEAVATGSRIALGIAVERRDGMSWSATSARRAIEAEVGDD